ncbi:MAG: hypothetical protein QGG40_19855, partial [Myxococcota bacterium]|nr:hypothetical protein [Myxococcota bacterium]
MATRPFDTGTMPGDGNPTRRRVAGQLGLGLVAISLGCRASKRLEAGDDTGPAAGDDTGPAAGDDTAADTGEADCPLT